MQLRRTLREIIALTPQEKRLRDIEASGPLTLSLLTRRINRWREHEC
jgi:hypothetical protein